MECGLQSAIFKQKSRLKSAFLVKSKVYFMEWSTSNHRPPHLYMDDVWYFVTISTLNKSKILCTDSHLKLWVNGLKETAIKLNIDLAAWVILPNHSHLLFMPKLGRDISAFIKQLNGRTSRELNLLDQTPGRKVWYSYWDICIRDERGFWTRFNYIHYNPVKHGFADRAEDWPFSSYHFHLQNDDQDWLTQCYETYSSPDLFDDDKF